MLRHAVLIALCGWLLATPAAAELPEPQRHGDYCPPTGCRGTASSGISHAAGFGLASLAMFGLVRRRGDTASPRP